MGCQLPVFHRFGNRIGLMQALVFERAHALGEAVTGGPQPLGLGAPARDRLLAFLDAVVEVVRGDAVPGLCRA